jgi:predicted ribosomally synthesized peptide with nif11-like leader
MSKSEVERFANAVRADKGLQEELKKAAVSNEAIVAFAKDKGYDVNLNEIVSFVEAKKATLSEEDLDKVAGGKKKGGTTNVQTNVEVQAEVTVQVVQTQTAATTTTAAAEAECVIIAT